MRRLSIVITVASGVGCSDKAEAPAAVGGTVIGSARGSAARDSAAATVRREDLAKLPNPLAASIAVPLDAKVVSESEPQRDRDGLMFRAPVVTVTGAGPAIKLSTDAALGWIPTTAEADLADNQRRDKPFQVAEHRSGPGGEWAIAYRWDAEVCFVRGWSPRARVLCAAVELKVKCAEIRSVVDVCLSIEPSGEPLAVPADPAAMFPKVSDPRAIQAVATAARAVVHDDRAALLSVIGPRGLMLKGKRLSRAAFARLLDGESIQKAFDIDCRPPQGSRESACAWTSEGTGADGALAVLAHEGFGVVPQLTFTRERDGGWLLTKVDAVDLGEP